MNELVTFGLSVRLALASIHPVIPWLVLAGVTASIDELARRLGFVDYLSRRFSWGKLASETVSSLPTVIFSAAFPLLTSGDTAISSAVQAAVIGAFGPLLLAIRANPIEAKASVSMIFVGLALTACGLFGTRPVQFDDQEKACLAKAEVDADAKVISCGKSVSGDCSTEAIIEKQREESHKCLR